MAKLNWAKAAPYRPCESKIKAGTVLSNGAQVPWLPKDNLAKRADLAMKQWLQTLSRHDRAKVTP